MRALVAPSTNYDSCKLIGLNDSLYDRVLLG